MKYTALGDEVSVDFAGTAAERGVAERFAAALGADLTNLSFEGCTSVGLLDALDELGAAPDIVTLSVGGSDLVQLGRAAAAQRLQSVSLLAEDAAEMIVGNVDAAYEQVAELACPTIVCTVFEPRSAAVAGVDALGLPEEWRRAYRAVNLAIESLAAKYGFALSNLSSVLSSDTSGGLVSAAGHPTPSGADAIARDWLRLYRRLRPS